MIIDRTFYNPLPLPLITRILSHHQDFGYCHIHSQARQIIHAIFLSMKYLCLVLMILLYH